jgi:alpha-galactosidase
MTKTGQVLAYKLAPFAVAVGLLLALSDLSRADDVSTRNRQLSVAVRSQDGSYAITAQGLIGPVIRSIVGAEIDHRWVKSTDYPKHEISQSDFQDLLGHGHQLTIISTGLTHRPDLACIIRLYDSLPFGDIEVEVRNRTANSVTVQAIRSVEAVGNQLLHLGGAEKTDRVLSDSFSENWPNMRIYDLGEAPQGMHRAVGSQLVYNRESKESLFLGALTSLRFLTIMHLQVRAGAPEPRVVSYTVDSTGTTEVQASVDGIVREQAVNGIGLSLPLASGGKMSSERLMFTAGNDYFAQLETYAGAIRRLHSARVKTENLLGWWSWTSYYLTLTEGTSITNALWLAQHLKALGYDFFHVDFGYEYARGEYTTADAAKFPHGMRRLASAIRQLGLRLCVWTAPFEVGERAWVYEHHKDWLVHNARDVPIQIVSREESDDRQAVFVLDATHPGAQQYLRQTYRTLAREWGVRYIKLDFMDNTAIEGHYYRPHTTALEAQRIGLEIIREAVGDDVLLDKDGSPMLNPVGLVDTGRISLDSGHSFRNTKESASGIAARYYMHRTFFVNDPDAFNVTRQITTEDYVGPEVKPLTLSEAQVAIVLAAMSGGMFEIGDDLPRLGSEPDRLALVTNRELLQIAKLGRASKPLDLMTYQPEDEQPSVMFLPEDQRLSMLAVFNWSEQPRSHVLELSDLKLPGGHSYRLFDALNEESRVSLDNGAIVLSDQPPHSVRLIKIIDDSKPAAPPTIDASAPMRAKVGEEIKLSCTASEDGVPALAYHWDFGDGVVAAAAEPTHAYTVAGTYAVKLTVDGVDGIAAEKTLSISVDGQLEIASPRRYTEPSE